MVNDKKETHRLWHLKNRTNQLQRMKEWRLKNQDRVKEYRSIHHLKNRDRINQHKKQYRLLHPEKMKAYRDSHKEQSKEYRTRNRERILERRRKYQPLYYQKNKQKILAYGKKHNQLPHVKARRNELERIRRRANPKSNRRASYDLQDAMNNARVRDKNTCQWAGCGLTFRQVPIHVHHIFPRNEYPDLELIEQYMICYCANHHGLFHRARGDPYSEMIPARYQERGIIDYQEVLR
jgi:hypothetical protein